MRPLPEISWGRGGVFTRAEALADGWTEPSLRHAVATGGLSRLRRGVYARPPGDRPGAATAYLTQQAVAAALTVPDTVVSHLAAARMRGWSVWSPTPRACVTRRPGPVTDLPDVHVHRGLLTPADLRLRGGLVVTSPGRTVVDIAREFGTESALVTADAAFRAGDLDAATLAAAVDAAAGRPGVDAARRLPGHVDGASESVLESRSRWRLHREGIPRPSTQTRIYDLSGRFVARVDFFWPEFGVVGEADGEGKYADRSDVVRERRRQRLVERLGLEVERWGWSDLPRFSAVADALRDDFDRQLERRRPCRWRTHGQTARAK